MHPALPCCGHPSPGAFADQFALELSEGGEDGEDHPPLGPCGVNTCALAGEDLQADAARGQLLGNADEIDEASPEPIQLPRHQNIALTALANGSL
jgi:hypothetical protein